MTIVLGRAKMSYCATTKLVLQSSPYRYRDRDVVPTKKRVRGGGPCRNRGYKTAFIEFIGFVGFVGLETQHRTLPRLLHRGRAGRKRLLHEAEQEEEFAMTICWVH